MVPVKTLLKECGRQCPRRLNRGRSFKAREAFCDLAFDEHFGQQHGALRGA